MVSFSFHGPCLFICSIKLTWHLWDQCKLIIIINILYSTDMHLGIWTVKYCLQSRQMSAYRCVRAHELGCPQHLGMEGLPWGSRAGSGSQSIPPALHPQVPELIHISYLKHKLYLDASLILNSRQNKILK